MRMPNGENTDNRPRRRSDKPCLLNLRRSDPRRDTVRPGYQPGREALLSHPALHTPGWYRGIDRRSRFDRITDAAADWVFSRTTARRVGILGFVLGLGLIVYLALGIAR